MKQDVNPAKEYITVKLKRLEGMSYIDYHRISFNVTN